MKIRGPRWIIARNRPASYHRINGIIFFILLHYHDGLQAKSRTTGELTVCDLSPAISPGILFNKCSCRLKNHLPQFLRLHSHHGIRPSQHPLQKVFSHRDMHGQNAIAFFIPG